MTDSQDRMQPLLEDIAEVLNKHAGLAGDDLEMPVVADWAITVSWDDAGDGKKGRGWTGWPRGQWRHRTAGMLQMALDDVREINRGDDES